MAIKFLLLLIGVADSLHILLRLVHGRRLLRLHLGLLLLERGFMLLQINGLEHVLGLEVKNVLSVLSAFAIG